LAQVAGLIGKLSKVTCDIGFLSLGSLQKTLP
jgi:hypothetical protein